MKYFIDTEFIEGTQKTSIFSFKKEIKPTIDLISIGIVAEDGREYYAISKDFNLKEAWNRFQENCTNRLYDCKKEYWIRDNVLKPIFNEFLIQEKNMLLRQKRFIGYAPDINDKFSKNNFKRLLKKYGKTNKEIAKEIRNFVMVENYDSGGQILLGDFYPNDTPKPEFYAYYGAYDWVVFCWLFGKMIDLPRGFPMFSRDLKVMLDDKVKKLVGKPVVNNHLKHTTDYIKNYCFDEYLLNVKASEYYPKQNNIHNALDDAKWNQKLYNFIKTL